MPTRNVNLTDHYDRFIADAIDSGRYRNASEVMRAGLRLLEQQTQESQQRLAALRSLAAEGLDELDQGRGIEIDGERQLRAFISRIGRRAATAAKRRPKGA
ncbi:MAG: type II toxin-antitoxin system ParD family antitoxin [Bauldia sp.]|nr:MAG: type II toxin-antitoxin system ParD family antitoxin [Bauldia sp.]